MLAFTVCLIWSTEMCNVAEQLTQEATGLCSTLSLHILLACSVLVRGSFGLLPESHRPLGSLDVFPRFEHITERENSLVKKR